MWIVLRSIALAVLVPILVGSAPAVAQSSPGLAQIDRVPERPDLTARVQMNRLAPGWATPSRDVGSVPDSQIISFTVVAARAPGVQAAFEKLLQDQQNPNSPRYHHWLTPEQIGVEYGPTQHDLNALTGWLSSQGLRVDSISPNRVLVHISGSSSTIAKAFGTSFRMFTVQGEAHYSIVADPFVPTALIPLITTIHGLSQIPVHSMQHVEPATPSVPAGSSEPQFSNKTNTVHYLFPADFATIFNINPLYAASINGAGSKVAVIGQSDINVTDITTFETVAGLATNTPNIITVPGPAGKDPGVQQADEGESDLDLQRVIGVAPGVTADFVTSGPIGGQSGIDIAMSYEVDTLKDPIMTLSYGGCEAQAGGQSADQYYTTLFGNASAEGITIFISSDDSGAAGCDRGFEAPPATQQASINFFCANPYATCVGGTEFIDTANPSTYWSPTNDPTSRESALGYIPEGAWNDSTTTLVAASGGGVSAFITKPSFQAGPGVPADGFRDVPDVSFPSSGHDGYFGCQADLTFSGGGTGNCAAGGGVVSSGTSAAAPGWAGVAALLNQKLGSSQGSLNPLIYRLGNLTTANPFHDITPSTAGVDPCDLTQPSLCNNTIPSPNSLSGGLPGYGVTPGYDLVTGWGSIDVNNFISAAVTSSGLKATATALNANPASITTAQTVVFTASVSASAGVPDGAIQFTSNGAPLGAPVTLVNGVATGPAETFSTIGTYTISASYSGSNTFSDSAASPLLLNVVASGTTTSTTVLSTTATVATPTSPVGFSVVITGTGGTPTGSVQFKINGNNDGNPVAVTGGSASLAAANLPAGSDVVTAVYSGDNTFAASTSNAVTVVVTAPASTTTIGLSANTTDPGGYVVITGTVTGVSGGPAPTGTLTLYQGAGQTVGSSNLINGTLVVSVGFATGSSSVGTYPFYWGYSGDLNYAPSQSATVNFTVDASFVPTYLLGATAATVSSSAGAAASNTITISSANGFSGTIGLSCAAVFAGTSSDNVILPTCSFSPASTSFPDANATVVPASVNDTVAVTLSTVVPAGVRRASNWSASAFAATGFAGLLMFSIPGLRRRRSWNALASALLLAAALGLSGCGSGGSSGGSRGNLTGTPSGNYTITVTGVSTGAPNVTTTFTLSVQ